MSTDKHIFDEAVCGDEGEVASLCIVRSDDCFVHIVTDAVEGYVMMHVSVARKLLEVLPRAIAHVEAQQIP